MKLDNYEVTLDWEADQKAGPTGFVHWLFIASLTGDDGNEYNVLVDPFFAKLENIVVLMMRVSSERGNIYEKGYLFEQITFCSCIIFSIKWNGFLLMQAAAA